MSNSGKRWRGGVDTGWESGSRVEWEGNKRVVGAGRRGGAGTAPQDVQRVKQQVLSLRPHTSQDAAVGAAPSPGSHRTRGGSQQADLL